MCATASSSQGERMALSRACARAVASASQSRSSKAASKAWPSAARRRRRARAARSTPATACSTRSTRPRSGHRGCALRGAILAETGDHSGAADAWQAHLAARPDSAEARYRLALLATRAGNDDDAARWLGEALRLDPSLPDIQGLLGRTLLKLDRVDEAAAVLDAG